MSDLIDRQAAIDALENTKTAISENGERYIAKQNAIMRIDALPSAQPTFDARDTQYNLPIGTDCISRRAAIDAAIEATDDWDGGSNIGRQKRIENYINRLPSAQPERIKGRWERDGHHIKCDQCGEWMCDRDREGWDYPKNFCPNCGAKMEGVDDE